MAQGDEVVQIPEGLLARIPERLRERPFDARRKVPVPFFNESLDGVVDYTAVDGDAVARCLKEDLCGACGQSNGYWKAFIGGPVSATNGMYLDPPMHRECAEVAMEFCPHIRVKNHRITDDAKRDEEVFGESVSAKDKPERWIIVIARDFKLVRYGRGTLLKVGKIKDRIEYAYNKSGVLEKI